MGQFGQLYAGAIITAVVGIAVAVLNGRSNRDTKKIDASVATAELQNNVWKDLLAAKDAENARLNGRVKEQDQEIAERDAIIASFIARLGPALDEKETHDDQSAG